MPTSPCAASWICSRVRQQKWEVLIWGWLVLVLIASGLVGFFWYLAPLAMGFSGAHDGGGPATGLTPFILGWYVGLPLFAVGQIAAFVWAFRDPGKAALLATALLASFLVMIFSVIG